MDSEEGFEILKCMAPTESELKTAAAVQYKMFYVFCLQNKPGPGPTTAGAQVIIGRYSTKPWKLLYSIVLYYSDVLYIYIVSSKSWGSKWQNR